MSTKQLEAALGLGCCRFLRCFDFLSDPRLGAGLGNDSGLGCLARLQRLGIELACKLHTAAAAIDPHHEASNRRPLLRRRERQRDPVAHHDLGDAEIEPIRRELQQRATGGTITHGAVERLAHAFAPDGGRCLRCDAARVTLIRLFGGGLGGGSFGCRTRDALRARQNTRRLGPVVGHRLLDGFLIALRLAGCEQNRAGGRVP